MYTTLKVGGPARYFVIAKNTDEMVSAVQEAHSAGVSVVVIGGGSNVLVSDLGFSGLVVIAKNDHVQAQGAHIIAEAGAVLARVSRVAYGSGLSGLEFGVGIPGSVGGAVVGNASNFIGAAKDVVHEVLALDEKGKTRALSNAECRFWYRHSVFKEKPWIVLQVTFALAEKPKGEIKARMDEITVYKKKTQKTKYPTSGCMFKNPRLETAETRAHAESKGLGEGIRYSEDMECETVPLRVLLEKLNMKGFQIGGIAISESNANFLENRGGATAEDVIMMMSVIKQKVRDHFGIQLFDEVQMIGFK